MVLEHTLPILILFLIGVVLKKAGVLRKADGRLIRRMIVTIILPATVVNALWAIPIGPSLFLLPLASIMAATALLGVGFALAPIVGLREKTRAAFLIAFPTLEVSSIGYALMIAVYGMRGLAQMVLFDLGSTLFFLLVVPILAALLGRPARRFQLAQTLAHVLKNPILWAYAGGLACHWLQIPYPPLVSNLCMILSQALLVFMMLLIASELELPLSALTFPVLTMYLKMAVGVTLGLLLSLLFGLTGVERVAVVLGSSLPASVMTIAFARISAFDASFLAATLSLAVPTALGFGIIILSLSH